MKEELMQFPHVALGYRICILTLSLFSLIPERILKEYFLIRHF